MISFISGETFNSILYLYILSPFATDAHVIIDETIFIW